MKWRLVLATMVAIFLLGTDVPAADVVEPLRPNILWIMADDLGYGDLGCYGQKRIQTPNIDRLASEGMRFTDCYAGSTVCAPSRCALMTGLHTGHARVRGNARVPLEPGDVTIAEVLKSAGYATGIVGKWGLGEPDSSGMPNRQGFDFWFGYLNQHHAHNYYPDYLWRNEEKVLLPNVVEDNVASKRVVYSADLFADEAIAFLKQKRAEPFFLYLALTLPHANNEAGEHGMEVPSDAPYSHESWPPAQKNQAAMITYLDTQVGKVLDVLHQRGLDDDTIVFFTSDNGPHREGGGDPDFFDSNGPLRGIKRALYEGGIRVPMIVRWPGKVAAGAVSHQPWAFWDALPTLAGLAEAQVPPGLDGISIVPTLIAGKLVAHPPQEQHAYFYWEFHERGSGQAVRIGDWKAVRSKASGPVEVFDLTKDLGEEHDVAANHPQLVAKAEALFKSERTDSPHWPLARQGLGAGSQRP